MQIKMEGVKWACLCNSTLRVAVLHDEGCVLLRCQPLEMQECGACVRSPSGLSHWSDSAFIQHSFDPVLFSFFECCEGNGLVSQG